MDVINDISEFSGLAGRGVLTIGNFDGVHTGHQRIIKTSCELAAKAGVKTMVLTFEPHPVAILYPEKAPGVLTRPAYKKKLLAELGVDIMIVLDDSSELLELAAEEFVERFLISGLRPAAIVEGPDFNFGIGRGGSVETLRRFSKTGGYEVVVVPDKEVILATGQSVRVSSTMIRYMLESGHVSDARAAIGREYRLIGRVVAGRGQGRKLGFATLNMEMPSQVIPAEGVYAGYVMLADSVERLYDGAQPMEAVFSIGQARTFGQEFPLLIEAHALGRELGSAQGKYMAMDFVKHIRSQHKFASEADLIKQIKEDCQFAGRLLADNKR